MATVNSFPITTVTLNGLPAFSGSPDGVNDLIALYQNNTTSTVGASRNQWLGITSQPLGLTDTQSPTNKTFNNTNAYTAKDSGFTLQNASDLTKQGLFSLAGNTTSTTRTYTLPNVTDTLVSLTATQTLTNKTLTAPAITGGTIDNSTVTIDTLAGHTASTTGTFYGISVASGVISTANSIGAGANVTNGVQAAALATNAITLGYAQITSTFTTTSTSAVQVTGLTVTVTIPIGGRRVKITADGNFIQNSAGSNVQLEIWDGTVGTGTRLAQKANTVVASNDVANPSTIITTSPSAGSKTYNVAIYGNTGTTGLGATSTSPAFILVELI